MPAPGRTALVLGEEDQPFGDQEFFTEPFRPEEHDHLARVAP
jgi:hypothetical protein